VTSASASGIDESSGATNERVVTGGSDHDEGLTTLHRGGSVALVTLVLVDGERFTGDGGLVDLEERILGDNAAVGGNDGTLLDLQDVTGNDLGSLNLLQGAIAENDSLESESPGSC
jgi:hypothetical protein